MTDATILIPTHRHASLLPYAIESALDQAGASVEVFVAGDGVEQATRDVIGRYAGNERVRYFDRPKGPRLGEAYRHAILQEANGRIVAYLGDDDLLLRDYVADMLGLLESVDFAHPVMAWLHPDGTLQFLPWNYSRPEFQDLARRRTGSIGFTGTAHTLEAYRRLPYGWRTTPGGVHTDHWMWIQFLELPGYRAALGERLTHLTFPEPLWRDVPDAERTAQLADWLRRSREPGFADEADRMLRDATRRAAEDHYLRALRERAAVQSLRATRTWRLRERLVSVRPLRALAARRP